MRYAIVILTSLIIGGCALRPEKMVVSPDEAYHASPDPVLACKLLKAAQCAYAVKANGEFELSDKANACAPWKNREAIASGAHDIDAVVAAVDADALVIAFRGTLGFDKDTSRKRALLDWIQDARNGYVVEPNVPGHVHRGFRAAVSATWSRLLTTLRGWKEQGLLEGKKIYVTGHSKGGSAAVIAAAKLSSVGFKPDAVYTYAAARAGDEEFAKGIAANGLVVWRYENHLDLVPHLPPNSSDGLLIKWFLESENLTVRDEYQHTGLLLYLNSEGEITAAYQELERERIERFERFFGRRDLFERIGEAHSSSENGQYYSAICKSLEGAGQ